MMNSSPLSTTLLRIHKRAARIIAAVGTIGFFDAAYVAAESLMGRGVVCIVGSNCDAVLTSPYAYVGPVPLALIGAVYYAAVVISAILFYDTKKELFLGIAGFLGISGFVVSLVLVWLQVFVIHSICFYCMVSAATSTALCIIAFYYRLPRLILRTNIV